MQSLCISYEKEWGTRAARSLLNHKELRLLRLEGGGGNVHNYIKIIYIAAKIGTLLGERLPICKRRNAHSALVRIRRPSSSRGPQKQNPPIIGGFNGRQNSFNSPKTR